MKILAFEHELPGATGDQFQRFAKEEAHTVWDLYQAGVIRELYFRADQHTAVLVLESDTPEAAAGRLAELPFVREGLIHFELIPLQPYSGFARLFSQAEAPHQATSHEDRLAFMSPDHHKVRDFVVLELPRTGAPIPPQEISTRLNLSLERTLEILDDLERGMTFLFRNPKGEVAWAYPVTADPTPHRIRFSSGEQIYAA